MASYAAIENAAVLAAVAGQTPGATTQALFSSWAQTASTFTLNSGLIFSGDFSGVSTKSSNIGFYGNGYQFTAIAGAPYFLLTEAHTGPVAGQTVVFTGTDSTSYTVTLSNVLQVGGFALCLLTSALPSAISGCELPPANFTAFFTDGAHGILHANVSNQTRQLFVMDSCATPGSWLTSSDTTCQPFGMTAISGDSGSPLLARNPVSGLNMLVGTIHSRASQGSTQTLQISTTYDNLSAISAGMTYLAATCSQFTTASLGTLSTYTYTSGDPVAPTLPSTINITISTTDTSATYCSATPLSDAIAGIIAASLSGAISITAITPGDFIGSATATLSTICNHGSISSLIIGTAIAPNSALAIQVGSLVVNDTGADGTHSMALTLTNLQMASNLSATLRYNSSLILKNIVAPQTANTINWSITGDGTAGGTQSFTASNCMIYTGSTGANYKPLRLAVTNHGQLMAQLWQGGIDLTAPSTTGLAGLTLTRTSGTITLDERYFTILGDSASKVSLATTGTGSFVYASQCECNASTDGQATSSGAGAVTGLTAAAFWLNRTNSDYTLTTVTAWTGPYDQTTPVSTDLTGNIRPQLINGSYVVFAGAFIAAIPLIPVTVARSGNDLLVSWSAVTGAATYTVQRAGMADVTGITATSWTDTGAANAPRFYRLLVLDTGGNVIASGTAAYTLPNNTADALCLGLL